MELTSSRQIAAALAAGHGKDDESDDTRSVRVRHVAGHRSGDALTEWWGCWPQSTAEQVAQVLAAEFGGRVTTWAQTITVVSGRDPGGRPPVGPLIALWFPPALVDRLDAAAATAGTTRSALLRQGAELALTTTRSPAPRTRTGMEMISVRMPKDLTARLDARKQELRTDRSALIRLGAELVLEQSR